MTRADNILERYSAIVGGGSSNIGEELENLMLTEKGSAAVSRVHDFLTESIKGFNVMMKWDWPTLTPSLRQLNSDDLEWEVTVNSESNGDKFVGELVDWANETLIPAVSDEFGGDELNVTASVESKSFPKENEDEDIDFATITVQLSGLKAAELIAAKQDESLDNTVKGMLSDGTDSETRGMISDGADHNG